MKILTLAWEYPPRIVGGLARHVEELSQAQVRQGDTVHVVTADHPGTHEHDILNGVHVHRVKSPNLTTPDFFSWVSQFNFGILDYAFRLHQEEPFDIIHAHDWLVAHAAITLKSQLNLPLVATIHATEAGRMRGIHSPTQQFVNDVEWWLNFNSWRTIVCSHFMQDELMHHFHLPIDKLDVIPNGVQMDKFDFEFDHEAFRRLYAADHEPIVLFVGRMVIEKGVQVLIDAVPQILAQIPEARFILVGTGPYLDDLKAQADYLGISHKVTFTGYVDDQTWKAFFKVADAAVFPSLYEPFGIVALEAMAARLPLVVSDTGGLGEIIDHGVTGIKTFPNNSQSIAWGLLEILRHPEYAQRLQKQAYQKVSDTYGWEAIARQTKAVYERVLTESTVQPTGKSRSQDLSKV